MFKLYAIIVSLAFLVSQTGSIFIPLDDVLEIQSSAELKVRFQSTLPLLSGEYTQELIVKPETCSIRIDFNKFTFSPPIQLTNTTAFVCELDRDVFEVTLTDLLKINLPALCGELSGQHIYLQTRDYDQILLDTTVLGTVHLKATVLGLDDPLSLIPEWDITLTQIPCQSADDVNSEPNQLSLPPAGCLQYYTEPSGTVESFNLRGGSYLGDLNFSICIQQFPDTCGIKLSGNAFELSTNGGSSTGRDCDTAVELNVTVSKDYLLIPDGRLTSADVGVVVVASEFCGTSLLGREVTVETQGPLSIKFVTDTAANPLFPEVGFQFDYKLLTDC